MSKVVLTRPRAPDGGIPAYADLSVRRPKPLDPTGPASARRRAGTTPGRWPCTCTSLGWMQSRARRTRSRRVPAGWSGSPGPALEASQGCARTGTTQGARPPLPAISCGRRAPAGCWTWGGPAGAGPCRAVAHQSRARARPRRGPLARPTLGRAGFRPLLLDWGEPGGAGARLRVGDYVRGQAAGALRAPTSSGPAPGHPRLLHGRPGRLRTGPGAPPGPRRLGAAGDALGFSR